jgi:hypothetical protein
MRLKGRILIVTGLSVAAMLVTLTMEVTAILVGGQAHAAEIVVNSMLPVAIEFIGEVTAVAAIAIFASD